MENNIGDARRSYAMTREDGKFSQEDAAKYFNVSSSTYQKWEQGTGKSLKVETLCRMADLYGTSIDYLLRRTDNPRFEEVRSPGKYESELGAILKDLNDQQVGILISTARNFAVANEKDGAGDKADVERAGRSLTL